MSAQLPTTFRLWSPPNNAGQTAAVPTYNGLVPVITEVNWILGEFTDVQDRLSGVLTAKNDLGSILTTLQIATFVGTDPANGLYQEVAPFQWQGEFSPGVSLDQRGLTIAVTATADIPTHTTVTAALEVIGYYT